MAGRRLIIGVHGVLLLTLVVGYNIDVDHPIVYKGPNGSFFGYSVLEHHHDDTRW